MTKVGTELLSHNKKSHLLFSTEVLFSEVNFFDFTSIPNNVLYLCHIMKSVVSKYALSTAPKDTVHGSAIATSPELVYEF